MTQLYHFSSQLIIPILLVSEICTQIIIGNAIKWAVILAALKRVKTYLAPPNNSRRKVEPSYDASRPQGEDFCSLFEPRVY